jgi:glutathione S-transferase
VLRNKPPELIACSSKATVPVLVLSDGEVIDESLDIMVWALSRHDPDGWLNGDRILAASLIEQNDNEFKASIDRYKYPERYPGETREASRVKGEGFLTLLEGRLENKPFLNGDQLSLVDVALWPFVRQFAYVDIDWFRDSRYVAVNEWLQRFLDWPLFVAVMEKYPAWQSGNGVQAPIF